jgi:thiol-disulfide isomerase/thioredoxin
MSNNEYGEDINGVRELSIDDFNLNTKKCVTNQGKNGLIIFYQYWCPHCRNIVPEVVKANKKLKNKHLIMAVHGDNGNNDMIFDNFGIMGIPSIKFMDSSGKITKDYDGPRESESFIEFIKNNSNKPNKKKPAVQKKKEKVVLKKRKEKKKIPLKMKKGKKNIAPKKIKNKVPVVRKQRKVKKQKKIVKKN